MYEVVQEHAKFAKGGGTRVGKELLSLPYTPEYNYAANTYLTALAYIRELEERLTKREPDTGDSGENLRHFSSLIIFPVGRIRRPRPSAGNALTWRKHGYEVRKHFDK